LAARESSAPAIRVVRVRVRVRVSRPPHARAVLLRLD
jgi:hypothetical protein